MKNKHLLLSLAAAAVIASPSGTMARAIWTSGHGGHKMKYAGTNFAPVWGYAPDAVINGVSGSGGEYALGTLLPVMPYSASSVRPAGAAWDFIGAAAGADLWVFPATQDPNLPWIGFSTTALTGGDWTGNITITLASVSGSGVDAGGHMSIYTTDAFGDPQAPLARTFGGIGGTGIVMVPGSGHLHPNFAFTRPGTYNATYTITGTHAVDGAQSATATYNFQVVPEPGAVGLALLGLSAIAALNRRAFTNCARGAPIPSDSSSGTLFLPAVNLGSLSAKSWRGGAPPKCITGSRRRGGGAPGYCRSGRRC